MCHSRTPKIQSLKPIGISLIAFTMKSVTRVAYKSKIPLFISAELKMDILREREVKDSLERQLTEERKLRGKFSLEISFIFKNFLKPASNPYY